MPVTEVFRGTDKNVMMSMNVKNVRGSATITLTAPTPWALITADVRKVSAGMELHALRMSRGHFVVVKNVIRKLGALLFKTS